VKKEIPGCFARKKKKKMNVSVTLGMKGGGKGLKVLGGQDRNYPLQGRKRSDWWSEGEKRGGENDRFRKTY